ncbi:MAG TPA: alpha/beta hydrolase [Solirubrobacterales bacterium]|nr:alpha/beta hydrolase [Solirubrobacterales bacterium]
MSANAATFTRPGSPNLGDARRFMGEMMSTRSDSSWPDSPPGDGRPAMLVPGFLAGDPSLSRMARWLRAGGWETTRSGIQMNVGCMESAIGAIEARLDEAVGRAGRRALLIGQSRGGSFGRVLAVRRPDLVETLVTLGSPVLDQMAISRSAQAAVTLVGLLGTVGVPGLFGRSCRNGDCCERARRQLTEPVPQDVRYIAFYSRQDPIVSWEACLDPGAELVEVNGTHSGMGVSRTVWERMAQLVPAPSLA